MLTPEQIPDAVIDAAVAMRDRGGSMSDIIRTAINAWPGVGHAAIPHWPGPHQEIEQRPFIILPLTENPDAEA